MSEYIEPQCFVQELIPRERSLVHSSTEQMTIKNDDWDDE